MNFFPRILEKAIYAFIIFIAVLFLWSVLFIKNAPRLLVVLSGSMEPSIHTGSVVFEISENEYEVQDVITFGKDNLKDIPTTHRIVAIRNDNGAPKFTTKGDANNTNDGVEIDQSEIRGKVLFSVPFLGYIIDFIKKPLCMMLVVILLTVVILYNEIRKIINEINKMKNKNKKE